jgi:hydrogenase assembly chaperone HypC/HupF
MCLAAPGRVVTLHGKQADIDYGEGIMRTVVVADYKPNIGDFVLVQMGIVVKILAKAEAQSIAKAWKQHNILDV